MMRMMIKIIITIIIIVRSVLLAGPEGSGKSMLIHAICTELGATVALINFSAKSSSNHQQTPMIENLRVSVVWPDCNKHCGEIPGKVRFEHAPASRLQGKTYYIKIYKYKHTNTCSCISKITKKKNIVVRFCQFVRFNLLFIWQKNPQI